MPCLTNYNTPLVSRSELSTIWMPPLAISFAPKLDETGLHHSDPPKDTQHRDLPNTFEKYRNNA